MGVFQELRRRNVFRIGAAYLAVTWLSLQVVGVVTPILDLPAWIAKAVLVTLAIGFPVALLLAWAFELTPEGIKPTSDVSAEESITAVTGQKLNRVLVAALALAVVLLVVETYFLKGSVDLPGEAQEGGIEAMSLAVLPFENLSSDAEQDYFADGMSEELMDRLSRLQGLQVTGKTSSFYFKGRNEEPSTIGKMLGVEYLLEGSTQKSGDKVRISARLINAATGFSLWTDNYDRGLDDIFAIQDEISDAVATALSITIGVGELGQKPGMTRNLAAYDAYLKGLNASSPDEHIADFRRAIDLDPQFALAWNRLANSLNDALFAADAAKAPGIIEQSTEALQKAMDIAPDSLDNQILAAEFAAYRGDLIKADELLSAISSASGSLDAVNARGSFLVRVGKVKESIPYLERVRKLEPLNIGASVNLEGAYENSGDFESMFAEAERGLKIAPINMIPGTALVGALATNDRQSIDKWAKQAIDLDPAGAAINQSMFESIDDPAAALAKLRSLYPGPDKASGAENVTTASWAAYFGDVDLATVAITAFMSNYRGFITLWRPLWAKARETERFKARAREVGLVDYWRAKGWNDYCEPIPSSADDFECH